MVKKTESSDELTESSSHKINARVFVHGGPPSDSVAMGQ